MSSERDPARWSELAGESAPELRQLFQNARKDVPSSSQLEGLWARLEPLAGPTPGPSPVSPPLPQGLPLPAPTGTGPGPLKLLGALAAVGVVGVVGYFLTRPDAAPTEHQAPAISRPSAPAPLDVGSGRLAPPVASEPQEAAPAPSVGASRPEPRSTQAPSASKLKDASAEAALLERAREAIASDPKRALALTREHARRFPQGILAQEREVIAIDALKRLGKGSEAETRVDKFKKAYPGSAHQHGLDSSPDQR